ncbi:MAG: dihydrodipicolinate synthase family protein, partial [Thalassobaculaceae bacterium]
MDETAIHGIYPMLYSFYAADGGLDRGAHRAQTEACVAAGVHGLATGGLASDCRRLTAAEKRQTIAWLAEDCAGRVPFSVTLSEPTAAEQVTMAEVAAAHGAGWLVLQPPPLAQASDEDLIAFFGAIADAVTLPVGIQNAPEYIGIGLS